MGDAFDRHLGTVLRRVRTDRGLSLSRVAKLSQGDFTATTVAGYERGERSISSRRLVALARVYRTSPDRLLAEATRRASDRSSTVLIRSAARAASTPEAAAALSFIRSLDRVRHGPRKDSVPIRDGELEIVAMATGSDPSSFSATLEAQGIAISRRRSDAS